MKPIQKSSQKPQTKKQRRRQHSDQEKFQREWERVQRLQRQNDTLREEIDNLLGYVSEHIAPIEQTRVKLLFQLNERLISFVNRRTLPHYMRAELVDWIESGFEEIQANPFAKSDDLQPLFERMHEQCKSVQEYQVEKLEKRLLKQGFAQEDLEQAREFAQQHMEEASAGQDAEPHIRDMFEDLFDELFTEGDESDDDADDERMFRDFFDHYEEQANNHEAQLEKLLKATPINHLFRKIARVLHPDLERDPKKKQLKHEQMSQLLHAREQNDVPAIIAMHLEHVGDIPEDIFDGHFDKLAKLLQYQAEKLQDEREDIIHEDPLKAAVYNHFFSKNEKEVDRKIARYNADIEEWCNTTRDTIEQIKNVKSLRFYLEQRQDARYYDVFGN